MNESEKPINHLINFLRGDAHPRSCGKFSCNWPGADRETAWQQIISAASSHLILPALSPAISLHEQQATNNDAAAFIEQIHGANARRNHVLKCDLIEAAKALNERAIQPMVLKGGAFLIEDADSAPWRFMSDLDLLVREDQLHESVAALQMLGYRRTCEEYDSKDHAHFPPLVNDETGTAIELHTRLFRESNTLPLSVQLFAHAKKFSISGTTLLVPLLEHRIAHLIAHAQIHNKFYALHRIMFRDFLDLSALLNSHQGSVNWTTVLNNFPAPSDAHAARSFLLAWSKSVDISLDDVTFTPQDRKWATKALSRLYASPKKRAAFALFDTARLDAYRIFTNADDRRRLIASIASPSRLKINLHRRGTKLRQMLWS